MHLWRSMESGSCRQWTLSAVFSAWFLRRITTRAQSICWQMSSIPLKTGKKVVFLSLLIVIIFCLQCFDTVSITGFDHGISGTTVAIRPLWHDTCDVWLMPHLWRCIHVHSGWYHLWSFKHSRLCFVSQTLCTCWRFNCLTPTALDSSLTVSYLMIDLLADSFYSVRNCIASAVLATAIPSVCHTPVLCQNDGT